MVKVNLIGFKEFADKLKAAPAKITNEVGAECEDAAKLFVRQAKRDAPKNEGQLIGGISYTKIDSLTFEVVSAAKHSPYMEFGTKGNYQPYPGTEEYAAQFKGKGSGDYYDFLNSILDWVKKKGLHHVTNSYTGKRVGGKAAKENLLTLASAIAFSILRKGVKPHPFFFKQISSVRQKFINRIERVLKSI